MWSITEFCVNAINQMIMLIRKFRVFCIEIVTKLCLNLEVVYLGEGRAIFDHLNRIGVDPTTPISITANRV